MKKITIISLFISLFSLAVVAQTKSKTKTAVKPFEAKTTKTKPTNAKPTIAKPKNPPTEKISPEKSKSVKVQSAKARPVKVSRAKAQPASAKTVAESSAKSTIKPNAKPPMKAAPKSIVKPAINQTAKKAAAEPAVETMTRSRVIPIFDAGEIVGKTYANKDFNFSVTLPDDWEIAGDDFERRLKKEGFNLSVETPKAAKANAQSKLNAATGRVRVLLTAYKAAPGASENAILRVSTEDLRGVPQVKDAVDYFDLMRATYQNIKLPAGFKYSETQAEKLGAMQFGFLDVSGGGAGKKRMYATVRGGHALMFTLTYNSDEDLAALKNVLAAGDFKRR